MTTEQWLLQTLRQMATSDAHRQRYQKTVDTLSPKHIETVECLSRYDLEFSTSVRERVRELRETIVFREIERIHDLRAILDRSQLVTEAANQNKAELDRIVT